MTVARPVVRPRLPWWQVGLTVVLAVGGYFAATQIRNELEIREHLRIPSTRLNELAIRLQKQERRRASLEAAVGELRHQVAVLEREAAERQSGVARMNREVSELRALAGFIPLEGSGVVVEMRDSPRPIEPGDDPNKTILHYTDIHAVINDLWAAGAEAVAVNGERIITRTGPAAWARRSSATRSGSRHPTPLSPSATPRACWRICSAPPARPRFCGRLASRYACRGWSA
ncbi:MAG: hypothetical protein XU14_C0011G0027 [Armatimonadetes bacterium CSP1-3]|nr:MAG: hypothetical protein XU14_C0011G0027 [Armatimonadetes bacterium CSP1-3]